MSIVYEVNTVNNETFTTENINNIKLFLKTVVVLHISNDITDLSYIFDNCPNLTTVDFPDSFAGTNVTSIERMYANCINLTTVCMEGFIGANNLKTNDVFTNSLYITNLFLNADVWTFSNDDSFTYISKTNTVVVVPNNTVHVNNYVYEGWTTSNTQDGHFVDKPLNYGQFYVLNANDTQTITYTGKPIFSYTLRDIVPGIHYFGNSTIFDISKTKFLQHNATLSPIIAKFVDDYQTVPMYDATLLSGHGYIINARSFGDLFFGIQAKIFEVSEKNDVILVLNDVIDTSAISHYKIVLKFNDDIKYYQNLDFSGDYSLNIKHWQGLRESVEYYVAYNADLILMYKNGSQRSLPMLDSVAFKFTNEILVSFKLKTHGYGTLDKDAVYFAEDAAGMKKVKPYVVNDMTNNLTTDDGYTYTQQNSVSAEVEIQYKWQKNKPLYLHYHTEEYNDDLDLFLVSVTNVGSINMKQYNDVDFGDSLEQSGNIDLHPDPYGHGTFDYVWRFLPVVNDEIGFDNLMLNIQGDELSFSLDIIDCFTPLHLTATFYRNNITTTVLQYTDIVIPQNSKTFSSGIIHTTNIIAGTYFLTLSSQNYGSINSNEIHCIQFDINTYHYGNIDADTFYFSTSKVENESSILPINSVTIFSQVSQNGIIKYTQPPGVHPNKDTFTFLVSQEELYIHYSTIKRYNHYPDLSLSNIENIKSIEYTKDDTSVIHPFVQRIDMYPGSEYTGEYIRWKLTSGQNYEPVFRLSMYDSKLYLAITESYGFERSNYTYDVVLRKMINDSTHVNYGQYYEEVRFSVTFANSNIFETSVVNAPYADYQVSEIYETFDINILAYKNGVYAGAVDYHLYNNQIMLGDYPTNFYKIKSVLASQQYPNMLTYTIVTDVNISDNYAIKAYYFTDILNTNTSENTISGDGTIVLNIFFYIDRPVTVYFTIVEQSSGNRVSSEYRLFSNFTLTKYMLPVGTYENETHNLSVDSEFVITYDGILYTKDNENGYINNSSEIYYLDQNDAYITIYIKTNPNSNPEIITLQSTQNKINYSLNTLTQNNITTVIANSGTGTSDNDGFISNTDYVAFDSDDSQIVSNNVSNDLSNAESLEISWIQGTDTNGGSMPNHDQSLIFAYYDDEPTFTQQTNMTMLQYNNTITNAKGHIVINQESTGQWNTTVIDSSYADWYNIKTAQYFAIFQTNYTSGVSFGIQSISVIAETSDYTFNTAAPSETFAKLSRSATKLQKYNAPIDDNILTVPSGMCVVCVQEESKIETCEKWLRSEGETTVIFVNNQGIELGFENI